MSWLAGLRRRVDEWLRPGRAQAELDDELRDYFERELQRQLQTSENEEGARRHAILRAGNLVAAREAVGDEQSGQILRDAMADVRIACRAARRTPGFSAAVVVSLALGVGGSTAVFGFVNALLVRPLPYPDADRLFVVRVWWNDFSARLSAADLLALQQHGGGVARLGAFFLPNDGFAMPTPAGPEVVNGAIMTADLPEVLGVKPILGAGFSSEPDAPEALISERLWQEHYGGSAGAVGRAIVLDGNSYTIVGVMPAGFNVPGQRRGQAWLRALDRPPTRRGPYYLQAIARLGTGPSTDAAAARLTALVAPVLQSRYAVEPNWRYGLRPLQETLVGDIRQTLLLLLGAVALVLVIAIVNVSSLMLARSTTRARELAVRASLGASRGRLTRHLLAESALLGLAGGALGLVLAWALLRLVGTSVLRVVPILEEARLDTAMVLFALAGGIGAGLLAGLLPGVRFPWTRLGTFLRDGERSAGGGPAQVRVRHCLVVAEMALTAAVLAAAVLLTKSLMQLQAVDPGFRPDGVATFRLSLPDEPYGSDERRALFVADLGERLRGIGGITGVAFALALPPDLLVVSNNYTIEGALPGTVGSRGVAEWQVVTPEYFPTMGIGIENGRAFTDDDRATTPRVAIVNESFVRRHYSDGQPLGRRLKGGDFDPAAPWTTIVGVVPDVPYGWGLGGRAEATVYLPHAQNLWVESPYVVLKASGDPARLRTAAQQAVWSIDPTLPLRDFATMEQRLRSSTLEPRLRTVTFALIAGLALALAVTGISGVMAYQVNQRRREIAIRRALGARRQDVVGTVVWAGLRLVLVGMLLGTIGAVVLSRSLSTLLFGVHPHDVGAYTAGAALLAAAAMLACTVPAVRTARIDPAAVLRDE